VSLAAPRRHNDVEVVCAVMDGDVTVATVRIDGDVPALFVVDAVARLDLAARRIGWRVRVSDPLTRELLALMGFTLDRAPSRREV